MWKMLFHVSDLKSTIVQETMAAAQNTRDRVQAKNCELQQQLAEQQRAAEDIHKELATAKDRQMVRQIDGQKDLQNTYLLIEF